jgi:hypothetical protein
MTVKIDHVIKQIIVTQEVLFSILTDILFYRYIGFYYTEYFSENTAYPNM